MDNIGYRQQKRILGLKPNQFAILAGLVFLQVIIVVIFIVVLMSFSGKSQDTTADNKPLPTLASLNTVAVPDTATPAPSATPRPRITSTPMPPPNMQSLALSVNDMPPGFVVNNDLGGSSDNTDMSISFAFSSQANYQAVAGYIILLPSRIEQTLLDEALNTEQALTALMNSFIEGGSGDARVVEQHPLPGMESIGNSSAGFSVVYDISGVDYRMEMIILRRNTFEVMLYNFYPDQMAPSITAKDMAIKLDNRIFRDFPMKAYILPQPTPSITYPPSPIYLPNLAISKFDLPEGFISIPPEEVNMAEPIFADFPTQYEAIFLRDKPLTILWEGLGYIDDPQAQALYDQAIKTADLNLVNFGYLSNLTVYNPIEDIGNVSDVGAGNTVIAYERSLGINLQYDIIMFRRGGLVAYVALIYFQDDVPPISLKNVVNKLDAHMQEALTP
jgi:hypothetical protein